MDRAESKLIEAAQGGDNDAFGQLVQSCQERVVQVAYGYLHDMDEARDVAQDAFVRAYRALNRFNGASTFWTWIYRITCNLCKDRLRRRMRKKEVSLEGLGLENEEPPLPSPSASPRSEAIEKELEQVVSDLIESLPEKHRRVLVLREIAGLSYQEVADATGCRLGTVMSRLFHARKKLAEQLEPYRQVLEEDLNSSDESNPFENG